MISAPGDMPAGREATPCCRYRRAIYSHATISLGRLSRSLFDVTIERRHRLEGALPIRCRKMPMLIGHRQYLDSNLSSAFAIELS